MQTQEHQSASGTISSSVASRPAVPLSPRHAGTSDASGIKPEETPSPDLKKEQEIRLKFAEETHQYVREYIRLADQKAIFFFAGSTALLTYLHELGLTNRWIVNPKAWSLIDMLAFVATAGLVLSVVACLTTVMPRLNGSKRGLIFFAAIREYESSRDYVSEVMKQSLPDLCDAKLKHTYDLSDVCKKKYDVLKWGQWLGAVAVVASLLLLVLLQ